MSIRDRRTLWKVRADFPSHCGTPAHISELWYVADSLHAAVEAYRSEYSHAQIVGIEKMGEVFVSDRTGGE